VFLAGLLGLWLMTPCLEAGLITFTNLISFSGTNGANPVAGLVEGKDGNLYGAAPNGGANSNGTIFGISADGSFFTNLYNFSGGTNGAAPVGALILGTDGNFCGTTFSGGVSNWGTVFRISTNGVYTQLAQLAGTNGANPDVALLQGADGSFYGATKYGGPYPNTTSGGTGYGAIFQIATNGMLTTPVLFNSTNGANAAALVRGNDGNFYGTTAWGGNIGSFHLGFGTIFRLDPDGTFTNLYKFSGGNDGGFPYANLVQGKDGNFYGTTYNGGTNSLGNVFQLTPGGQFNVLYSFTGGSDGGFPYAGLVQGSDGNLYGTTYLGGTYGFGTVFEITTGGNLTPLLSFTGAGGLYPGAHPQAPLVQGTDGNFYGVTYGGGTYNDGTVFRLSLPLPPVFKSVANTAGTVTLVWSAVAGQSYQLEYTTNLALPVWNNVGGGVPATNGTMTVSDSPGTDPQRFYRVVLFDPALQ
jgi:uncharacterized repeat protein (TIGR03803 family)